jgi:phage gp16-like protein
MLAKSKPAFNPAPRPAQFDRASQHRRSMIAKIQIARQQLQIAEDDYRQIVLEESGETSLKTLDDARLDKVLARMKRLGFKPIPKAGARPADHPVAKKARALWISLYHLGVVHNPSEQALEAFGCKQLKCEKLVWARQSDGYKLVEALKNMATRNGWDQGGDWRKVSPVQLRERLCEAILARLKTASVVPVDWTLADAAWRLCGIENAQARPWSAEDYDRLAKALGDKLRAYGTQTEMGL